jgi:hypothetical protein
VLARAGGRELSAKRWRVVDDRDLEIAATGGLFLRLTIAAIRGSVDAIGYSRSAS